MIFRKIQQQDNAKLAEIIRRVFDEFDAPKEGTVYSDRETDVLYTVFQQRGSVLWVVEENEKLLGCGGVFPTEGLPAQCAELVKLYLSPEARGKGIGKTLIEQCISCAKEIGYTNLYLESFPEFKTAVKMYEKLGFTMLSGPMGNSGHVACSIWMLKKLL